jgi:hypothetical protein
MGLCPKPRDLAHYGQKHVRKGQCVKHFPLYNEKIMFFILKGRNALEQMDGILRNGWTDSPEYAGGRLTDIFFNQGGSKLGYKRGSFFGCKI